MTAQIFQRRRQACSNHGDAAFGTFVCRRALTGQHPPRRFAMKHMYLAAAALTLMAGAAVAQSGNPAQPADPEQAQRKATINQPTGAGSNASENPVGTTTQPSDPEEAARKGGINQPGGTVTR
jgi:hypothetical protein